MSKDRTTLESQTDSLGTDSIWALLAKFGFPAMATMLISCTYNLVDKVFVGWGVGYEAIAAISSSSPVVSMIQALGVWAGLGASIIFAVKLGERDTAESERLLTNTVSIIAASGIAVTVVGLLFAESSLRLIGVEDEVMAASLEYLRIILLGSCFYMLSCGMVFFVRNEGRPGFAMLITSSGAVINIILDPVFIFLFKWGLTGAAAATVTGQVFSAGLLLWHYCIRKNSSMRLRARYLLPDLRLSLESLKYGLSSFISTATGSVTHAVLLASINKYGAMEGPGIATIAVSCAGIVTSIGGFIVMPVIGIQQAAQTIIGYNYGARLYTRVNKTTKYSILASLVYLTVGFAVIMTWAEELVLIYGVGSDPLLLSYAGRSMRLYHYCMILMPFSVIVSAHFQAVKKPGSALLLGLARPLLGIIPAAFILPLFFGVDGALAATSAGDGIAGVIGIIALFLEFRRLSRLEACRPPEKLSDSNLTGGIT